MATVGGDAEPVVAKTTPEPKAEEKSGHEEAVKRENSEEWPTAVVASKAPEPQKAATKPRIKRTRRDPMTVERCNLLTVCKLVVKELIDSSLAHGRMLDEDHVPLQQFFVVLEHVLRHGIKPKKGILRDKREFWQVLEKVEKYMPDAVDITTSVREMPNIKTPLGRSRGWVRLALMQKKLADYFRVLIDHRDDILAEHYEPGAMMLEDEAMVIGGLLVGLNIIDCNISIKDEDLDQPMGVIDFSLYLRDSRLPDEQTQEEENAAGNAKMAAILDQKNYLEELNRHLNATVANLQQKLDTFSTTNALMKEDLAIAKNNILQLQEENSVLTNERETLMEQAHKQLKSAKEDLDTERETYQTSRAGLDTMYAESEKKLLDETQMRLDVEKELELQISMKQEMEVALRLLEKDIHEKQDTMVVLRKQLDDIKQINLDMYHRLQNAESSLKHKTDLVAKLEEKTNQMASTIKDMETRFERLETEDVKPLRGNSQHY